MKVYWVSAGSSQQGAFNHGANKLNARLTLTGVQEIKSICTDFEDCINVYTSPAASAIETSGILFSGVGFKADARLLEAVRARDKEEAIKNQYESVKDFIQEITTNEEDAVVICHEGTIQMALCYVLEQHLELWQHFKIHTGTVVVTVYERNQWTIEMSRKHY